MVYIMDREIPADPALIAWYAQTDDLRRASTIARDQFIVEHPGYQHGRDTNGYSCLLSYIAFSYVFTRAQLTSILTHAVLDADTRASYIAALALLNTHQEQSGGGDRIGVITG